MIRRNNNYPNTPNTTRSKRRQSFNTVRRIGAGLCVFVLTLEVVSLAAEANGVTNVVPDVGPHKDGTNPGVEHQLFGYNSPSEIIGQAVTTEIAGSTVLTTDVIPRSHDGEQYVINYEDVEVDANVIVTRTEDSGPYISGKFSSTQDALDTLMGIYEAHNALDALPGKTTADKQDALTMVLGAAISQGKNTTPPYEIEQMKGAQTGTSVALKMYLQDPANTSAQSVTLLENNTTAAPIDAPTTTVQKQIKSADKERLPECDNPLDDVFTVSPEGANEGYLKTDFAIHQDDLKNAIESLRSAPDKQTALTIVNSLTHQLNINVTIPDAKKINTFEDADNLYPVNDEDVSQKLTTLVGSLARIPRGYMLSQGSKPGAQAQLELYGKITTDGSTGEDSFFKPVAAIGGSAFEDGRIRVSAVDYATLVHERAHVIQNQVCDYSMPAFDKLILPGDAFNPAWHEDTYAAVNSLELFARTAEALMNGDLDPEHPVIGQEQALIFQLLEQRGVSKEFIAFQAQHKDALWGVETPQEFLARGGSAEDASILMDPDDLVDQYHFQLDNAGTTTVTFDDGSKIMGFEGGDSVTIFLRPPPDMDMSDGAQRELYVARVSRETGVPQNEIGRSWIDGGEESSPSILIAKLPKTWELSQ